MPFDELTKSVETSSVMYEPVVPGDVAMKLRYVIPTSHWISILTTIEKELEPMIARLTIFYGRLFNMAIATFGIISLFTEVVKQTSRWDCEKVTVFNPGPLGLMATTYGVVQTIKGEPETVEVWRKIRQTCIEYRLKAENGDKANIEASVIFHNEILDKFCHFVSLLGNKEDLLKLIPDTSSGNYLRTLL